MKAAQTFARLLSRLEEKYNEEGYTTSFAENILTLSIQGNRAVIFLSPEPTGIRCTFVPRMTAQYFWDNFDKYKEILPSKIFHTKKALNNRIRLIFETNK